MQAVHRIGGSTVLVHGRASYRKPPEGEGVHPSQTATLRHPTRARVSAKLERTTPEIRRESCLLTFTRSYSEIIHRLNIVRYAAFGTAVYRHRSARPYSTSRPTRRTVRRQRPAGRRWCERACRPLYRGYLADLAAQTRS